MKKAMIILATACFVFLGTRCGLDDVNEKTDQKLDSNQGPGINAHADEEAEAGTNPFAGTWKMTTEEDGITVTTALIVNDDGSSDTPDVWVGTVDSTTSKVTGPDVSATVGLSEDFGIYRVEGDNIEIDAANGTATFTGSFTSETAAEGTWVHNQRGAGGTWKATKTE